MQSVFFLSVMNGSPWGGSEVLWFKTACHLARNGYKVGVCCFNWHGKENYINELKESGCRVYLLAGKESAEKNKLLNSLSTRWNLLRIPFYRYDLVVINQGGWKDIIHGPFSHLYRRLKKFVLLFHNYNYNERKFTRERKARTQQWISRAALNLGDTPRIFEVMKEHYGLDVPRQGKLFNPLTFDTPSSTASYPVPEPDYILSVFAANEIRRKAQDVLIRSLNQDKWKSRNWKLNLYGDGPDTELLRKLITDAGLPEKIILKGNAASYQQAIIESHLVLQITHIDAMPITVMDALSLARPVIVSNIGDMPLWVDEDQNGWICSVVNEEQIDKTLERAWNARTTWKEMGLHSREKFKANFPSDPLEHFITQLQHA